MLDKLYLVNLTLIITHEIDAAFWHEWEMFSLPGGIQFFNFINFLLILILVYGFAAVVKKKKSGFAYSIVMSLIGMIAFIIHSVYIFIGYQQFTLPVSLIILIVCFVTSVWQFIHTVRNINIFVTQ